MTEPFVSLFCHVCNMPKAGMLCCGLDDDDGLNLLDEPGEARSPCRDPANYEEVVLVCEECFEACLEEP